MSCGVSDKPIPASARASCSKRVTRRDMRFRASSIRPISLWFSPESRVLSLWACASATATGVRNSCAAFEAKARSPSSERSRRIMKPFSVAVMDCSSAYPCFPSIGSRRP